MLVTPEPLTLVTVTHPSCGFFLNRMPRMLTALTDRLMIKQHFVVINEALPIFRDAVVESFSALPWLVDFIEFPDNRWDLPAYNEVAKLIKTRFWIGVSPDTRPLTPMWVQAFFDQLDEATGLVGPRGPADHLTPETMQLNRDYAWVAQLLLDRGLTFDSCLHAQTWCFMVRQQAFEDVGGFYEPPDRIIRGKGDVIAAEVYLSVSMRKFGHGIQFISFPMHHYGTMGAIEATDASLDAFDRERGFPSF